MRIIEDYKLDYQDVLIRPKRSTLTSRKDVDITRTFSFYHSKRNWTGIPIMSANMDSSGTFEIARVLSQYKIITTLHKFYSVNELKDNLISLNKPDYIAYSLGIRSEDLEKLDEVLSLGLDKYFSFVCLDVPNGYLERFVDVVRLVRKKMPDHIVIAGNVVTNEVTENLILSGADIIKIGIGPGAACTTRKVTGVGYPQLSAVIETADAAHGLSSSNGCGRIIADGGIREIGDIAKAFCAGADFVMIGSLFAGYEESGGDLVVINGKKYKEHYGMSSNKAMKKHYGVVSEHRASEGRSTLIPYKGSINDFIKQILGGLRSCGTYIGARQLKEFSKRATFVKVSRTINRMLENNELE